MLPSALNFVDQICPKINWYKFEGSTRVALRIYFMGLTHPRNGNVGPEEEAFPRTAVVTTAPESRTQTRTERQATAQPVRPERRPCSGPGELTRAPRGQRTAARAAAGAAAPGGAGAR